MCQNPGLNVFAAWGIAHHSPLEAIQDHQHGTQRIVGHVSGTPRLSHEAQMQQTAHAAPFIVQAQRECAVQFGDQQQ